jgi:ribonuclease P/MRP protein subunit RPP1
MIETQNIEEAKQLIKNEKKPIIVKAQNDNFNRKMLEYGKFDALVSVEMGEKKRKLRKTDSGFNHVLAAIAAKNKVALGVDFEELRKLEKKEKAEVLARIIQNLKICRKAGVKTKIINAKDKRDAFSFFISLGASTKQAREAIS